MTTSNGNIFRVTGLLCGEFIGHRWIPYTRASDAELWCFFDLRLNKRLGKQSWGWRFDTLSRPLWRYCNVNMIRDEMLSLPVSSPRRDVAHQWEWRSGTSCPLVHYLICDILISKWQALINWCDIDIEFIGFQFIFQTTSVFLCHSASPFYRSCMRTCVL